MCIFDSGIATASWRFAASIAGSYVAGFPMNHAELPRSDLIRDWQQITDFKFLIGTAIHRYLRPAGDPSPAAIDDSKSKKIVGAL
jgi:hypothetical protein